MNNTKQAEYSEDSQPRRGDLTQGPILRTLLFFSVPTLIANLLQTLGGTINAIWVGQLLGETAVAATANANLIMIVAFAFVFGFGTATTVKVGQYFGARDMDAARRAFGSGTGFCAGVSIIGLGACWVLADPMLRLLATPPAVHGEALIYMRMTVLSLPFATVAMMITMSLRGMGDARTPLFITILSTVMTAALNPLFILGYGPIPRFGIAGAALAILIANIVALAVVIAWIYRRDLPLRLKRHELSYLVPRRSELTYVVGKGLPMAVQMVINSGAGLVLIGLVNREGLLVAAAYAASLQVWAYLQMPAYALSMAVTAMIAQNLGAGRHERANPITMAGIYANVVMTGSLGTLLLLFDGPLLTLFLGHGSQAVPIAQHMQMIATWAFVLAGIQTVLTGAMRAYGVVIVPLIVIVIALYPARLGFYAIAYRYLGADALWWSYPAGAVVSLILMWPAYRWGNWRPSLPIMGKTETAG